MITANIIVHRTPRMSADAVSLRKEEFRLLVSVGAGGVSGDPDTGGGRADAGGDGADVAFVVIITRETLSEEMFPND